MLKFAVCVLMNGFVFGGAALVARYGLRLRDRLAVVFAAILFGWVYIVVGLEALGLFGQIRLVPALGLAAGGFLVGCGCWVLGREGEGCVQRTEDRDVGALHAPYEGVGIGRVVRFSVWLAVTLAAWAAADTIVTGLCGPVQPVSDAPIYHLYFAVRWWQAGTLEIVPTPFGESAAPYFPANADVWFTWLLLPWSSEVLAKVGQWPFLIVGMAAVYALARELSVRPEVAVFPAVLWGTGSLTLVNASFADVDVIMAAWFLIAAWFLVRYRREGSVPDLVCAAVAMGAVLGTKYIAIPFLSPLVVAATVFAAANVCRWRHLFVLIVGLIVPSAFWYGRNLLLSGNPLYPLHTQILDQVVFDGWYTRGTMLTSHYHIPVFPLERGWRVRSHILLRICDPVLLPAFWGGLVAAIVAGARRRWLARALAVVAWLHLFCFWFVNPYQTQERFLLTAFGLLTVPVALLLDRWRFLCLPLAGAIAWHLMVDQIDLGISAFPGRMLAPFPLLGIGGIPFMKNPTVLGRIVCLVAIGGAGVLLMFGRRGGRRLLFGLLALIVAAGGIAFRAEKALPTIEGARWRFYPIWPQGGYMTGWHRLEDSSGRGVRVAYAGTNLPYYLFGVGLRNEVRYVNINKHGGFRMHDYRAEYKARGEPLSANTTPDWDRRMSDEAAWLKNLQDQKIELLFIGLTNRLGGMHNFYDEEGFPIERTWADGRPDTFRLLHADRFTRLYTVKSSSR
jgi:uncharacterized protein (DUF2062 family)